MDDAVPEREADQAGHVEDLQPLHHLAAMGLDGLDAQLQREGDFLDRPAFGDQLQDLPLPSAERLDGTPARAHRPQAIPARKPLTTTRETALLM